MRHAAFQTLTADGRIDRHRHSHAYAALVLSGGYRETGDRGWFEARAGQVLIHGAWEAHMNAVSAGGARVLNLPLPEGVDFDAATVADPDAVARAAERDPAEAAALLVRDATPLTVAPPDWPDVLARALRDDPDLSLSVWAAGMNLAAATVSRGFARAFGTSPRRYRAEQRALRAVRSLDEGADPLAGIAAELGFVDQAHMTRAVVGLTGLTPGRFRVKSIQSGTAVPT
ncbi:helix-turn-helix domain-containing protein [Brevundimonas sp.]|uniref:helix-turn-helix domain-containing protein n=1 Tax=Brevundimonas sp. TaxID=1871086 RepID=UPI003D0B8A55